MSAEKVRIVELPGNDAGVRRMLVDLALDEQDHYDHPRETEHQLDARLRPKAHFTGENHILVAQGDGDEALGLCWVVLYDPGNGLEAEVAELYVRPEARGRGIATQLMRAAMALMRERLVTFASVWTRDDNPAALAAYRAAGFTPTRQTVLTWLPVDERRE